jgi:hypothetical protein
LRGLQASRKPLTLLRNDTSHLSIILRHTKIAEIDTGHIRLAEQNISR